MQNARQPRSMVLSHSYLRGNEAVCNEDKDVCEGGRSLITSQVNNSSKDVVARCTVPTTCSELTRSQSRLFPVLSS